MIKFKYSFTLAFEKYGLSLVWGCAVAVCSIVDGFNALFDDNKFYYYLVNTIAFVLGWFLGVLIFGFLSNWLRRNTIWSSEWEDRYGDEKALCETKSVRIMLAGSTVLYHFIKLIVLVSAKLFLVSLVLFTAGTYVLDLLGVTAFFK
ncbi:hypothetical protein [Vibrio chemaguriensis]